ncbi:Ubiquitin-conjugating enzyme E2-17 kDa [Frankliniella fusca]|uniref:Ubiquitin-conjugating enzyme E2-17 kDa n=1 Tax=Frankliniella fusca TaxID=407009 RepID=A0AAE1LIF1_9NEOP|nr:Ubiquitin-conjugating enzyme E2-17 kDa [Frankliniella fusca]
MEVFRNPNRVRKDFAELANNDTGFIRLMAETGSMKTFNVEVDGPTDSPYHTGKFVVNVTIPPNFPYDPPKMKLVTRVWHPNISCRGKLCVDILDENWVPGMTLLEVLEAIRGLLSNPNPNSPLNVEAAVMYRDTRAMYEQVCITFTNTYAEGRRAEWEMEEKVSVLTALGVSRWDAVQKLAMMKCNVQDVIDDLHLD